MLASSGKSVGMLAGSGKGACWYASRLRQGCYGYAEWLRQACLLVC